VAEKPSSDTIYALKADAELAAAKKAEFDKIASAEEQSASPTSATFTFITHRQSETGRQN
jgi:hypothetical protein